MSEPEEIDYLSIQQLGVSLSEKLGQLSLAENRTAVLGEANELFDQVPGTALFASYDVTHDELSAAQQELAIVDQDLDNELNQLDGLIATFTKKRPSLVAAARQHATKKRQDAKAIAEQKRSVLAEPIAELQASLKTLDTTIEAVGMAWPAGFSEEDVKQAQARLVEVDEETTEIEFQPQATIKRVEAPRVLGPYADLAQSIPDLDERLLHSRSLHSHVYGDIQTARNTIELAQANPGSEQAGEADILLRAVIVLQRRFLSNPKNLGFLDIFEAKDIIDLTKKLNSFNKKTSTGF